MEERFYRRLKTWTRLPKGWIPIHVPLCVPLLPVLQLLVLRNGQDRWGWGSHLRIGSIVKWFIARKEPWVIGSRQIRPIWHQSWVQLTLQHTWRNRRKWIKNHSPSGSETWSTSSIQWTSLTNQTKRGGILDQRVALSKAGRPQVHKTKASRSTGTTTPVPPQSSPLCRPKVFKKTRD